MFNSQTKEKFRVSNFPVASKLINHAMTDLIDAIKNNKMSGQTKNKLNTIELYNKLIIFDDINMTQNDIILAR